MLLFLLLRVQPYMKMSHRKLVCVLDLQRRRSKSMTLKLWFVGILFVPKRKFYCFLSSSSPMVEEALKKLEDQLTCGICLNSYTEPKVLECLHAFCKECLEGVCDRQGQSLRCPSCRQSTCLPPTGVSGLQTEFRLNNLFEVRDVLEKVKEPQKTQCENCKKHDATSFCHNCWMYIFAICTETHQKWS